MSEPAVVVVAAGGDNPQPGTSAEPVATVTDLTVQLCESKIQECETRMTSRMDAMESRIMDSLSSLYPRMAETEQIAEEAQATAATAATAVAIAVTEPEPERSEMVEVIAAPEPPRSEPENREPPKQRSHWLF